MKHILTSVLIVLFALPTPAALAATDTTDAHQQLIAIAEYLERYVPVSSEPLTTEELRTIINDSAHWVVTAQEDNGHFGYEYLPFADEYVDDDGMVRQAGTLFVLAEVYKYQTEKDPKVAEAIEQAIAYFTSISQAGSRDGMEFWCITNGGTSARCDLGSTSLTFIGILNYLTAVPEKAEMYQEQVEMYRNFLIAARLPERGFSARYNPGSGFSDTESTFYNGETMLALVRYYQYEEDESIRAMVGEVFDYIRNQDGFESPLYLWMMATIKDMQRLWPTDAQVDYARAFTGERLQSSFTRRGTTHNYCAPLEGLVSAYSVLEPYESAADLALMEREINFWLRKTLQLQLHADRPYRVVEQDGTLTLLKLPNPAIADGGFLTSQEVLAQRIDFTQHCASAYLQKLIDIDRETL